MVDREKMIAEAREWLGEDAEQLSFTHGLYFGRYLQERLLPYPDLFADEDVNRAVEEVRQFMQTEVDPAAIDQQADIPRAVIDGLGRLGVLGMSVPREAGGRGFSQTSYCRVLEEIGARCASTAVFVNAHHSIGVRALVLFGTPEQQRKWLPKLATGEHLGAFALTEPQAGSDAGNVQTMATPTADGKGFKLNGEKRYITNGAIAQCLTVMARTPVAGSDRTRVTAFLVSPDMPGFEVLEARMPKCGIRGTATARLKFTDMFVPRENVLGQEGKGLRIALTVLDFGRTTFGASCTGAAKFCVARAVEHANQRVQFGETLGSFELVKDKLAYMASGAYAMEACTYQTAALIDAGHHDYKLETAMLKVFSTDVLWRIVNDTLQIYGGAGYFNDQPFERMIRDARINMIGEGANDVLRAMLISMDGLGQVGRELKGVLDALAMPIYKFGTLRKFAGAYLKRTLRPPEPHVDDDRLLEDAVRLGKCVAELGSNAERFLRGFGGSNPLALRDETEEALAARVIPRQYQLGRIADSATELYASACVLSRLNHALKSKRFSDDEKRRELALGRHFLRTSARRVRQHLADMWDNEDESTTAVANLVLGRKTDGKK